MAEAAGAGAAVPDPLLRGLPDEISIWEILVRLAPKSLLCCRAVCRGWRRATSSRDFLLAHHRRQPALPLLGGHARDSLDIIPFDPRAGLVAADQLRSVARLGGLDDSFHVEASCDGLLVISVDARRFTICNPATRQYAPLPQLRGFSVVGMYLHRPTGEYRLLANKDKDMMYEILVPDAEHTCYSFTIGSSQPPRRIWIPDAGRLLYGISVLAHGNLHWQARQIIMVFDPTAESFREMRSPVVSGNAGLFEIDGTLGMFNLNDEATIMDIWVMQDYQGKVWTFKHLVELSIAEITAQFEEFDHHWTVVVESLDGDVLLLVRFGDQVLQLDIDGKLVASFHREGLGPTQHRLKQTLVSHTFFPRLEGYVVNASPFI